MNAHAVVVTRVTTRRHSWIAECATCGPLGPYVTEQGARLLAEAHAEPVPPAPCAGCPEGGVP
jgi:hypothetical protein